MDLPDGRADTQAIVETKRNEFTVPYPGEYSFLPSTFNLIPPVSKCIGLQHLSSDVGELGGRLAHRRGPLHMQAVSIGNVSWARDKLKAASDSTHSEPARLNL